MGRSAASGPLTRFLDGSDGLGAFELAFRVSHINLNDQDVAGGELNDLTFG